MAWITVVKYQDADERLQAIYDRTRMPDGTIDNVLLLHGLRPHTLEGHLALYRSVLHHPGNTLPKWFLETLGVWVSSLNGCDYCVSHHARSMMRFFNDPATAVGKWVLFLRTRVHPNVASVALANRQARTAWALLTQGTYHECRSAA